MSAQDADGFTEADEDGFTSDGAHPLMSTGSMAKQDALQAAKVVGKGLDYAAGGSRALLAKIAEATTGKQLFTGDELKGALNPTTTQRFPTSAELMQRAGVPTGASLSDAAPKMYADPGVKHPWYQPEKGGLLDPTVRGAGGFAADVASDPITWMSYGGSAAAKKAADITTKTVPLTTSQKIIQAMQGMAQQPSNIVRGASEKLYNSAIPNIIQAGKRYGNPSVAETMLDAGIRGNPAEIADKMESVASTMKQGRDQVMSAVDSTGNHANLQDAFQPVFDTLQQHVKDGRLTGDQAAKIMQDVSASKVGQPPNVSTSLMSQWKTDVGDALPGSTWDELATGAPTIANEIKQAHQSGLRQEVERASESAIPGAGTELANRNSLLGDLINTRVMRAARMAGNKFEKEPFLKSSDIVAPAMAAMGMRQAGAGAGNTAEAAILAFLAQKGAKALGSTATRTNLGVLGDRLMKSSVIAPALDGGAARSFINGTNPWQPLEKK